MKRDCVWKVGKESKMIDFSRMRKRMKHGTISELILKKNKKTKKQKTVGLWKWKLGKELHLWSSWLRLEWYGDICICITDSLCYKAETNTPL